MLRVVASALLAVCIGAPAHSAGRLFVCSKEKASLQVFDAESGALQFEITDAGAPHQVVLSPDGRLAYTCDAKGIQNTISVIDVAKRARVKTFDVKPLFQPHGLVLNHDGSRIFVTSGPARAVAELQTSPLKVTKTYRFLMENVENVALSTDEKLIFATSKTNGNVVVLDTATGEFERAILAGYGAEGLDVTPDGKELWVANPGSQTVSVINIADRKRVHEIKCVGNPMHVAFTPAGDQALVTCAMGDRLAIIDRASRTEIARFEVGDFPVEIAFGGSTGPVFVSCERGNDVAVVDLAARKVVRRIPCGGQPEGIAYGAK